jgi:hypothetical protein
MSVEEEQRQEIVRLTSQVDQLKQQLHSATAEVERLRSSASSLDSEQFQTIKAELDHERQKAKAIWAAVRYVAGEDAAGRIEEEVLRRPIVAAPKVRRRGTMPHMPAPHMTVVAKTVATPKWPPAAPEETAAAEVNAKVQATVVQAEQSEGPKPEFGVESHSVPPSVARRLFDLGFKGKDQKETTCPSGESLSLKLDLGLKGKDQKEITCPSGESLSLKLEPQSAWVMDEPQSARVADVPSPMRRRESSAASLSSVPPLLPQNCSQKAAPQIAPKSAAPQTARSATPTGAVLTRRVAMETPPPPQVTLQGPSMATPTSVRDRVRQLELSARRSSIQS